MEVLSIIDDLSEESGISISKAWMNGEVVYNIFICHNHFGKSFEKLFTGLKQISKLENPDSYGLIHMLNEDDSEFFDIWQVWKFAKNDNLKVDNDQHLSPYSKKIAHYPEDEV